MNKQKEFEIVGASLLKYDGKVFEIGEEIVFKYSIELIALGDYENKLIDLTVNTKLRDLLKRKFPEKFL